MISFVTWCNNEQQYQGLLDTLPDDSEAIKVGQDFDSMAKAYNYGTTLAKGDIIVYLHQDVRILDKRFPDIVAKASQGLKTGFCGPIGSDMISSGPWWEVPRINLHGWIIAKNRDTNNDEILSFGAYDGLARQLDGLMLVTRQRFHFPEELPGIHFLDLWACRMAEEKGFQNRIFSCAIQHLSWGETSSSSYKNNYEQYKAKWLQN